MSKVAGGFLLGFFLAAFIFGIFIQVQLAPLENDLKTIEPAVKTTYEITHSGVYQTALDFASWANGAAQTIASIPFVGGAFSATQIPTATRAITAVMTGAKNISEKVLRVVESILFMIQFSIPLIVVSVFMMLLGLVLIRQASAETAPADPASLKVKYCANCGSELECGVKFCGGCGEKI